MFTLTVISAFRILLLRCSLLLLFCSFPPPPPKSFSSLPHFARLSISFLSFPSFHFHIFFMLIRLGSQCFLFFLSAFYFVFFIFPSSSFSFSLLSSCFISSFPFSPLPFLHHSCSFLLSSILPLSCLLKDDRIFRSFSFTSRRCT